MRMLARTTALAGVLALVGCAGSPYVTDRERESVPVEERIEPERQERTVIERPEPEPAPREPERRAPSAVDTLLQTAQRQHDAGQYEAAIATAERALRMERSNPEIYLLIGNSYLALLQNEVAGQFARQGLSFAGAGSRVAQQLQLLLTRASN